MIRTQTTQNYGAAALLASVLSVAVLSVAALSGPAIAAEEDAVATVNGVPVPKSRFDLLLTSQTSQGQQDTPAFREELREIMITREVLAQEAKRREMDQSDEYKAQLDAMQQQLLITALFNALIQEMEPTEEAKRAHYESIKAANEAAGQKEYLARHILVDDPEQAQKIIDDLQGGADFATLAKEYSNDTGTKENGGQLNWAVPQGYVKPFADAIVALGKGGRTETPVQSNFGYHVIEVLDVRTKPFPPYAQVEEQLRKEMLTASRDELITKLRNEATIKKIGSLDSE
ncbi:MAG: peptidylprolyl isomerase [Betaproteobacteria bacterium]|nr:MAG: peptidylprolyl isomerase [Betaproteobacteria bacterium]